MDKFPFTEEEMHSMGFFQYKEIKAISLKLKTMLIIFSPLILILSPLWMTVFYFEGIRLKSQQENRNEKRKMNNMINHAIKMKKLGFNNIKDYAKHAITNIKTNKEI